MTVPPPPLPSSSSLSFRGCCLLSPQGTLDLGHVLSPFSWLLPQHPSHAGSWAAPRPASTFSAQPPDVFRSLQQDDASASGPRAAPQRCTKTPHPDLPPRPRPAFAVDPARGSPPTLPHTPPPLTRVIVPVLWRTELLFSGTHTHVLVNSHTQIHTRARACTHTLLSGKLFSTVVC